MTSVIDVTVRPKRQVTLPKEICQQLGISEGDTLELTLDGALLVARPKKARALEALNEIRQVFKRSGVTENELQETGMKVRRELMGSRHAIKS